MSQLRPHPGHVWRKRKRRAKRALKMAWFVRIALIITVVLALRTDAQLREALWQAGLDIVEQIRNPQSGPRVRASLNGPLTRSGDPMPKSRVKINRPPRSAENLQIDAQAIARQVTTTLESRKLE